MGRRSRRRGRPEVSGMLLVDKPKGWTSAQVTYKLRSRFGAAKAGHTGTLDPLATGLVQILFGEATKLIPFMEGEKEYEAVAKFGVETQSHDLDEEILREVPVPDWTLEDLDKALDPYRGTFLQVPPKISAVRYKGERLYKLSRQGVDAPRQAKEVHVPKLEIISWEKPMMTFRVVCSRGTYLRSLVRDLGEDLGVPAALEAIRRIGIGSFRVEEAADPQGPLPTLRPAKEALRHMSLLEVGDGGARRIRQGQPLVRGEYVFSEPKPQGGDWVRVEGRLGDLVAIAQYHADGFVRIRRVMNPVAPAGKEGAQVQESQRQTA